MSRSRNVKIPETEKINQATNIRRSKNEKGGGEFSRHHRTECGEKSAGKRENLDRRAGSRGQKPAVLGSDSTNSQNSPKKYRNRSKRTSEKGEKKTRNSPDNRDSDCEFRDSTRCTGASLSIAAKISFREVSKERQKTLCIIFLRGWSWYRKKDMVGKRVS